MTIEELLFAKCDQICVEISEIKKELGRVKE
jgi:hypothetical protein|nr:MAG TPA: hypothetical protein [Caudoviricetes sp.]